MGAERRCSRNDCRRTFRSRYGEGSRAGKRGNARAPDRQGLRARADVPRGVDTDFGLSFQGADVSLLRRDALRDAAPVSGSIAQPEIKIHFDGTDKKPSVMQSSPLNFRRVI